MQGENDNYFEIYKQLPSLNEIIKAARTHWTAAARQKKNTESYIRGCIQEAQNKGHLTAVAVPVIVCVTFYERTKRRDCDNVQAGVKFILDAMKDSGIIQDDSRKYVVQVLSLVRNADADGARVEIYDAAYYHARLEYIG